jgi:uncharacterized membrane protein
MKPSNTHHSESGQILLILTVGIVALLGFLALAVDGGMIYADRRFDQNAADASSFAGQERLQSNCKTEITIAIILIVRMPLMQTKRLKIQQIRMV